jgi:hypothetical protein
VSYLLGNRDADAAFNFMSEVADRLQNRVQQTTDVHQAYLQAVVGAFGIDVVYAMLVKHYGPTADLAGPDRKYSPGECCGITQRRMIGKPIKALVSTSYVEKHNQTMRLQMKRYSRRICCAAQCLISRFLGHLIDSLYFYDQIEFDRIWGDRQSCRKQPSTADLQPARLPRPRFSVLR